MSTVGFPAMSNTGDGNGAFARLLEEDPVVAAPEAEAGLGRIEFLYVSIAGGEIATYAVKDLKAGLAVDCAEISARLRRPNDGETNWGCFLIHTPNSRRIS
jgi:hypothetical protein